MTDGAVLLPAALAGSAVLVLALLPRPGGLRLSDVTGPGLRLQDLTSAGLPVTAARPRRGRRLRVLLALALAAPGALLLVGPVPALLAAAGALLARRAWTAHRRSGRTAAERVAAVEACAALASELRAGRTPAEALSAAAEVATGPSRRALASAAATAELGGDVPAALLGAGAGAGAGTEASAVADVLRALSACWSVCARSGSGLAAAVERLEEGLRAGQAQRRALEAELAGPRATAGLLAVLPLIGLLLAAALGADPLHVLLGTPLGGVCLVLGLGLDALGVAWTRRLAARAAGL